ncbi:sodium/hydrogen exchanger 10 isoform X2 [Sarcophilus harrisii]|uniref:Solute carrier family 9 member C1 n=1 Tax=Sarcophilus harrisii TaxID=9305 RepID=G3VD84_SARHA|nr:sodium/hydrogen exchanger 10 isoform X2 [Sarcophilus harrisii]
MLFSQNSSELPLQDEKSFLEHFWVQFVISMFYVSSLPLPKIIFGLCIINILGAFLKIKLKDSQFPLPILLFLIGCAFEILSFTSFEVHRYTELIQWMDPVIFINLFTPVIIFSISFDTDFYMLQKLFWQIVILTVPGFFLNYALVDWYLTSVNKLVLENTSRVLFAIMLVCTDPMLTTSAIRNLGLSKGLTHLIKGECMLMAALAENTFRITLHIADFHHKDLPTRLSIGVVDEILKKFFGSIAFGFLNFKILEFWLRNIFNDDVSEGMLSFSLVYINFYVAEWSGMSGIISLFVSSLLLNSTSFKQEAELFLLKFWKSIRFFASLMIFTFVGMLIPARVYLRISFSDIYYAVHLYFTLIVIRILVFLILSPVLNRLGYGFTWRWAFTMVWSEMRGLFNINMALTLSYSVNSIGSEREKSQILLHGVTLCLITLLINSMTLPRAVIHLGLRDITLTKRKSLYYTVQHFQEITKSAATALRFDRDLANADWTWVEKKTTFQNPYKLTQEESEQQKLKCPKCQTEIGDTRISTEIMELARVRLLSAQIASYERQYASEILSQNAVKVLIGAAGSFGDKKGKFMSFQTIQAYVEKKRFFSFFRSILLNWIYNSKKEKGAPTKYYTALLNPILLFCHKIVFSDKFEFTGYLVILLNMSPLIISWIPPLNVIYDKEIRTVNHTFLLFYVVEAAFKILAMRKKFFLQNWNILELTITVLIIIEEILIDLETLDLTNQTNSSIIFLKVVKLLRIFRVFKLITPMLLEVIDKRMSQQLSFRYAILKGYVQGEADVTCIIDHISSNKAVAQELRHRVTKSAENAMKELGYLEYDHPDIAITMKTKEEINTLLKMASEILRSLEAKGIINKAEVIEIQKIIIAKKKEMLNFEPVIRLPSLDEILYHISWLNKSEVHINFIKKKVKILTFDCGNNIFEEGDDLTGIYLIVTGMIKRKSTYHDFRMDQMPSQDDYNNQMTYADYLISGAILGELNCLTNEPVKYTATCKTVVETYFIPKEHLYETFKECCPSIEYKIWLKLSLGVGAQKVKEILAYENWSYNLQLQLCNVYVRDVPIGTKVDIYDETVSYVILVYGSAKDCQLQKKHFAPTLIPKTCHQIQGIANITKLLVIQTSVDLKKCRNNTKRYVPVCKHVAKPKAGKFSETYERVFYGHQGELGGT